MVIKQKRTKKTPQKTIQQNEGINKDLLNNNSQY